MSDPSDYEHTKLTHEQNIRAAERAHDRKDKIEDMFNENADRHAQVVIRIVLALNGGAAISLLAFVGSKISETKENHAHLASIDHNLKWFIYGLALSGIAAMMSYATNFSYTAAAHFRSNTWDHPYTVETAGGKRWRWVGWGLHLFGIICVLAALATFMYGVYKVHRAISNLS